MSDWASLTPNPADVRETKVQMIVDAALPLFAQYGAAQTTLSRVAAEIGISKAALYRYIPNKAELEARCLRALSESAIQDFSKGVDRGQSGFEKLQFGLIDMLAGQLRAHGTADAILSQLLPIAQASNSHDPLAVRLRTVVELGISDGSILRADSRRTIAMLIGGLWAILSVLPTPHDDGPQAVAEAVVEQVLRGLDAWPKPSLTAQAHVLPLVLKTQDRVIASEQPRPRDV